MQKLLLALLLAAVTSASAQTVVTSAQARVKREFIRSHGSIDYMVDEVQLADGTTCVVVVTSNYAPASTSCDFSKKR